MVCIPCGARPVQRVGNCLYLEIRATQRNVSWVYHWLYTWWFIQQKCGVWNQDSQGYISKNIIYIYIWVRVKNRVWIAPRWSVLWIGSAYVRCLIRTLSYGLIIAYKMCWYSCYLLLAITSPPATVAAKTVTTASRGSSKKTSTSSRSGNRRRRSSSSRNSISSNSSTSKSHNTNKIAIVIVIVI